MIRTECFLHDLQDTLIQWQRLLEFLLSAVTLSQADELFGDRQIVLPQRSSEVFKSS